MHSPNTDLVAAAAAGAQPAGGGGVAAQHSSSVVAVPRFFQRSRRCRGVGGGGLARARCGNVVDAADSAVVGPQTGLPAVPLGFENPLRLLGPPLRQRYRGLGWGLRCNERYQ